MAVNRLLKLLPFLALAATSAHAADRYVATTGSDVGDCQAVLSPCLTLQYAINQASAGDTINVAAGTYTVAGLVLVNKTLTLRGAQAGVDARTRAAAESILSNSQGMSVSASGVVIDGFTIQDSTNGAFTGYGVWLNPGVDGTQFVNNIVQNNIAGLALANLGTTQAVVRHNLFRNNNQPGPVSGHAIYSDEFVSGAVANVLIDANTFSGNANAGVGLSSSSLVASNIEIANNTFDANGRSVYALSATSISIHDNTFSNATVPGDGGTSIAIGSFGLVTGMSVVGNDLLNGPAYGIRVVDAIGANTGIEAHLNNITGFATAGLVNEGATTVNAQCNWWGAASGPTNPANPGGTGDAVVGLAVFTPWLLAPAPGGACPRVTAAPIPGLHPGALVALALLLAAVGWVTIARRGVR
jgi:hypothetical protein